MRQLLFTVTALGLLLAPAAADQIIIGERDGKDIVTVRATEATQSKQALTIFTGISANTAGAKGLSLLKVIIPPGGSAEAHVHKGYELAVYLLPRRDSLRRGVEEKCCECRRRFHFHPAGRAAPTLQSQRYRAGHRHCGTQRALLFFQDVGSRRVADWGMGITSDGRRGYSLSGPRPEPTGQIGPPAAVMLLRAGQPGVGGRRR